MISLLQAGVPITLGDIGRRWGQTLVDPQLPTARRIRDEDAMLTACSKQPQWAAIFLSSVLAHLVRTLPATDRWQHLSASIINTYGEMTRGPHAPGYTGATLPDGRVFGGPDHPRFTGVDTEMDVEFAALSDGLTPEAAALFGFAADGRFAAQEALEMIRQGAIVDATWSSQLQGSAVIAARAAEQTWNAAESAIRWAVHRRRLMYAAQPITTRSYHPTVMRGGTDELPRDVCWRYASHTDNQMHSNLVADPETLIEAEIVADTLTAPVVWPGD